MTKPSASAPQDVNSLLDGGNVYAEYKSYEYILNFMQNTDMRSPAAYNFCRAVEGAGINVEGFPSKKSKKKGDSSIVYAQARVPQRNKVVAEDWAILEAHFKAERETLAKDGVIDRPVVLENLDRLASYLGMGEIEKRTLDFMYCHTHAYMMSNITDDVCVNDAAMGAVVGRMCNDEARFAQYGHALSPQGKFQKFGLMMKNFSSPFPNWNGELMEKIRRPDLDKEELVRILVGKPAKTELEYEDFEYLGVDLDMICKILENATKDGVSGVNILLYGPAGGGKTELSKAIAKKVGIPLFSIGEEEGAGGERDVVDFDDEGDVMGHHTEHDNKTTGQRRLGDLLRAQTLLSDGKSSILHFDEIEDLLLKGTDTEKASDTESKIAINTLLTSNQVPVIWNGNDPEKFHSSVRNRFLFSLFIDHPPVQVRRKIWERQAGLQKLDISAQELDYLAREYDASPRQIALSVKDAKISGMGIKAIEIALPASAKITSGASEAIYDSSTVRKNYDPDFSSLKTSEGTDFPLPALIGKGKEREAFTLFAQGTKGSGVRSLSRHIAEQIVMNPIECSMSALNVSTPMSSPQGNISSVFNSAADMRRILCVNDIEFLAENPEAPSKWDEGVTEFFVEKIRKHRLPVIVSSTKPDLILPKGLESIFTHKVKLGAMDEAQSQRAFAQFFGQEAPAEITSVKNLVAGDFSKVWHFVQKANDNPDPARLVALLRQEREIRRQEDSAGRVMGFGIPRASSDLE